MKRMLTVLAAMLIVAAMMVAGAGAALAVGGPNEAGNSGKFHPQSNPCQGPSNHPHCPGPRF